MKRKTRIGLLALWTPIAAVVTGCFQPSEPAAFALAPRTVDHSNFEPGTLSDAEIAKAASLRIYFEHASVGRNIFSDSENGFDLLARSNAHYSSDRVTWAGSTDPAWFDAHGGLADNDRGNPGADAKIRIFATSMTPELAKRLDVASFKFCWIDTPSDAEKLFAGTRDTMEFLQRSYPSVVFVWWTMPLERDRAESSRQKYNNLVRAYCSANNQWLLDIAALESHDDAGNLVADGKGRELQYSGYSSDGGHLSREGKVKLAKAYWRLIVAIAKS